MSETYIKLKRSAPTLELLKYPNAFTLGAQIALRANRKGPDYSPYQLQKGEALVGDYKSLGITRGQYRWAKKILERIQFATFRTTNRGTIAKLINSNIFDINIEEDNQQHNYPTATKRPSNDHQTTTNKNIKEEKELNRNKKTTNPNPANNITGSGLLLEKDYIPNKNPTSQFEKWGLGFSAWKPPSGYPLAIILFHTSSGE